MELEDKTERVRRMLRNMSARDAEQLVELIDLLNAHGLQHEAQKVRLTYADEGSAISNNFL